MRLLVLAVLLLVTLVHAEECTREERQQVFSNKIFNDSANYNFTKICPSLFLNSSENSNIQEFTDIFEFEDVSWLVKQGSCKDETCFSYLRDLTTSMPDCDADNINYKFIFAFDFVICARIVSSGSVSMNEIKQFYDDINQNLTGVVDEAVANSSKTVTTPANGSVPAPASASTAPTAVAAVVLAAVVSCALFF